jgi:hypothetical protein
MKLHSHGCKTEELKKNICLPVKEKQIINHLNIEIKSKYKNYLREAGYFILLRESLYKVDFNTYP